MRRVLIVDDDHLVAAAIQEFLKHNQCESVIAPDGAKGMRELESTSFEVAIVDLVMPGMDGIETIRAFRKQAPLLPIILMTGHGFSLPGGPVPDFFGMAAKMGAAYCLRKPISPHQLLEAFESCLGAPQIAMEERPAARALSL
jgi:DNA-binding response OmpR family regulator